MFREAEMQGRPAQLPGRAELGEQLSEAPGNGSLLCAARRLWSVLQVTVIHAGMSFGDAAFCFWVVSVPPSNSSPISLYVTLIKSLVYQAGLQWYLYFGLLSVHYLGWGDVCVVSSQWKSCYTHKHISVLPGGQRRVPKNKKDPYGGSRVNF